MGYIDKLPDPYELYKNTPWCDLEIVSRQEWGAVPPQATEEFEKFPIRNVILGYTETEKCEDKETCIKMMKELQTKHMAEGEPDIRFSYVVGWDQRVYEGRGFKVKAGTHPRYPKLKGKNVEVVLSGQRGDLPQPAIKSAIMYRLIDLHMFDNGPIAYENTKFTLDYEESAEADEAKLMAEVQEFNKFSEPITSQLAGIYESVWGKD